MASGIFLVGEFPPEYKEYKVGNDLDIFYYALVQNSCKITTYNDDRPNKLQSKFITKSNGKKALLISIMGENLETVVKDALLTFNKNLPKQVKGDGEIKFQPICEVLQIYSNNNSAQESFEEYLQMYNSKKR